MLVLALPISLQHLFSSSLSFIDVFMVGGLGDAAVAGVGLVNRLFFVSIMVLSGISSGASILCAQGWGRRDRDKIRELFSLALALSILTVVPFFFLAAFWPGELMRLFTTDPEVIELGQEYLKVAALFPFFSAIALVLGAVLRSMSRATLPMVAGMVAVCLNTALCYLLIYGHWGLPRMGVAGAAYATVFARIIEVLILAGFVFFQKKRIDLSPKWRVLTSKSAWSTFWPTTYPLILNELFWSLGLFGYQVVYGHMGTSELAAMSLLGPIDALMIDFCIGVSIASGIVLGQKLGANKIDEASRCARKFLGISLFLGGCVGLALACFHEQVLDLYSGISQQTRDLALQSILVIGASLFIRFFNMTSTMGVLRSGGDTRFALIYDIGTIWLIGLPLAALTGLIWEWPLPYVFAVVMLEELVKMFIWSKRIRSGKWLRQLAF